jgi:hypothetical protein
MIVRPDGRTYRPRKPGLRAHAWENDDGTNGCIVLGTLDPNGLTRDRARDACAMWFGDPDSFDVTNATPGWWRDGYGWNGREWVTDERRGAPGVRYEWTQP